MAHAHKNLLLFYGSAIITVSPWLFGFAPLAFVGLGLFLYSAYLLSRRYDGSNYAFILFSWFLLYNAVVFGSILYSLIPLHTYGISNIPVSIALVGFLWAITTIGYSIPGLILHGSYIFRKRGFLVFALAISFLWPLYEYSRASMMTIIWSGPQAHWGPHFSMASLGYFFHQSDGARFFSQYVGVFGVGLIVLILSTIFIWIFLRKPSLKTVGVIMACIGIFCFLPLPRLSDQNTDSIFFGLIQTNKEITGKVEPSKIANSVRNLINTIKEAASRIHSESRSIIILPEASGFFENTTTFISRPQAEEFLLETISSNSLIAIEEDTETNQSYFSGQRKAISYMISDTPAKPSTYQKTILNPGAEYLSTAMIGASRFLIGTTLTDDLNARTFSANTLSPHINTWQGIHLAPFTCSDSLSPLYTRIQSERGEIAFVHANLGHTRSNPFIDRYFVSSIQMHAASNNIPFLVAPNNARAMAINERGNIIATTENLGDTLLTGTIGLNGQRSWYNKIGDFPLVILGLTGFSLLLRFGKQRDIQT